MCVEQWHGKCNLGWGRGEVGWKYFVKVLTFIIIVFEWIIPRAVCIFAVVLSNFNIINSNKNEISVKMFFPLWIFSRSALVLGVAGAGGRSRRRVNVGFGSSRGHFRSLFLYSKRGAICRRNRFSYKYLHKLFLLRSSFGLHHNEGVRFPVCRKSDLRHILFAREFLG